MAEAPVAPTNPFVGGGTEQNIDRQKALLNDLLATEGQFGKQIYQRQAPEAQALLQQRLVDAGNQPDARKAVYDAFVRDASAAEGQHARTTERMALLNSQFLDQAKAAVPIHAQNMDQVTNALRMEYEDRQSARAQESADRAASRAASARANREPTVEELVAANLKKAEVNSKTKAALLKDIPRSQWTASDAEAAGAKGKQISYDEAAKKLGLPSNKSKASDFTGGSALTWNRKPDLEELQAAIDGMYEDDYSFEQVMQELDSYGEDYQNWGPLRAIMLTSNAGRWGIDDPATYGATFSQGDTRPVTGRPGMLTRRS